MCTLYVIEIKASIPIKPQANSYLKQKQCVHVFQMRSNSHSTNNQKSTVNNDFWRSLYSKRTKIGVVWIAHYLPRI